MTRTLHIRVESTADFRGLEEDLAALDRGEDVDPDDAVLSVESMEALGRILSPVNLELLQAIIEHEPESIRTLARAVDRRPPDVLGNVNELADYGLLELEAEGRAKRPVVRYDELDIDIALHAGANDEEASGATPA